MRNFKNYFKNARNIKLPYFSGALFMKMFSFEVESSLFLAASGLLKSLRFQLQLSAQKSFAITRLKSKKLGKFGSDSR